MTDKTKVFKYSDKTKSIKHWPYWGAEICLIFMAENLTAADEIFKKNYPEINFKNVSVSII